MGDQLSDGRRSTGVDHGGHGEPRTAFRPGQPVARRADPTRIGRVAAGEAHAVLAARRPARFTAAFERRRAAPDRAYQRERRDLRQHRADVAGRRIATGTLTVVRAGPVSAGALAGPLGVRPRRG